jgi:hypothetical protein
MQAHAVCLISPKALWVVYLQNNSTSAVADGNQS